MSTKTIVITGGSSGIGFSTALHLAESRQNLVLIAREKNALEDAAAQCRNKGATVLAVTADVSSEDDVRRVTDKTIEKFGSFDVWINNAGVISYGKFLDFSSEEFEQVIRTNVYGAMYGSRAALEHFKSTGRGTLINVASGLGTFPAPYVSPYVTSKYAVRGLTASLRQEIYAEKLNNIQICTILPGTIDTPIYQRSANTSGKKVRALPPTYSTDDAAKAIVGAIDNPRPEISIGESVSLLKFFYGIMPSTAEKLLSWYVPKFNYTDRPSAKTDGNLYVSRSGRKALKSGGWKTVPTRFFSLALPAIGILIVVTAKFLKRRNS